MSKTNDITGILDIRTGSAVAVVGCRGKTSLIELIALQNKDKKVLVTPTTKIFPMISDDIVLCDTLQSCLKHKPKTGVQCLGQYNERSNVLEALPMQTLADMVPLYDIVLMEADGSRGLPCKGWKDHEPVVPDFCTQTVGVLTMCALGKTAANDVVHHLAEFMLLTGLGEGDIITVKALEDMVCLPEGMFRTSIGDQYLVINQVENESTTCEADSFLRSVKAKYPGRFKRLIYGSVHVGDWHEV